MTLYHGGKKKIGKEISDAIFDLYDSIPEKLQPVVKGYCEPFCGMLGVYSQILDEVSERRLKWSLLAGDNNASVIAMWKAAKKGWSPPSSASSVLYERLKKTPGASAEKGYVGHLHAFRGKYFVGKWVKRTKNALRLNRERVLTIGKKLRKVKFSSGSYTQYSKLELYIIYCDPPYEQSSQYKSSEGEYFRFDNEKFMEWAKKMGKKNIVLVSEYKNLPYPVLWRKGQEKVYLII